MPRQSRLDAEGSLHHVLVRGNNKSDIFMEDQDRVAFISRLGKNLTGVDCSVYAWALLPNHVHLLIKSGKSGLSSLMLKQLTWYAGYFNHRYQRTGHLFENRFKSSLCEEERYFLALVRYINLNPLRAGLVKSVSELEYYPWCSHSVFLGNARHKWMDIAFLLNRFGSNLREARSNYRRFIQDGISLGEESEIKQFEETFSRTEKPGVKLLRTNRGVSGGDTRILGSADFIRQVYFETKESASTENAQKISSLTIGEIIKEQSAITGISVRLLCSGNRRYDVSLARKTIAKKCVDELGLSYAAIGRELGVTTSAIRKAVVKIEQS